MSLRHRLVPPNSADGSRFTVRLGRVANWLFAAVGALSIAGAAYSLVDEFDTTKRSMREYNEWHEQRAPSVATTDGKRLYKVTVKGKVREVIGPEGASYAQIFAAIGDAQDGEWPGALIMEGQPEYPPYLHTFSFAGTFLVLAFGLICFVIGRGVRYLLANE
ncbi:hypothetical protein [Sphingomonas sp. SAFR-052]|uniref:hypothetical protein n=1 Tax=Sphingomonas sp. SAFR-052 TaxID=3436867 RepID=UPI003F7E28AF